ncbi:hypothetical protein B0J14DRAFT_574410 [Halenospora varia]|nr:hypothetical protein B0J14DRAFT_574410 [Halenospora varia]
MQFFFITSAFLALAATTAALPQRPEISCWSTCSFGCVQAGNSRGGICSPDGTCSCLTKREAAPEPQAQVHCWSTCSVGCFNAGQLRGGLCSADGTCTCL